MQNILTTTNFYYFDLVTTTGLFAQNFGMYLSNLKGQGQCGGPWQMKKIGFVSADVHMQHSFYTCAHVYITTKSIDD